VPTATYYASSAGPGTCGNLGHQDVFTWKRLEEEYGTSANYAAKVRTAVDELVRKRWLTESDANRVKADLE
jgi:hypothetical protein